MAIPDLKNKWREIEWRNTAKTLPARAAGVARSPLWRRRAAWALGALLLLWALAYAALPPILKSQLEKIASEKLGRQVTVGAVDFRPWSLELTLRDLAIAKAGAAGIPQESPQLSIKRIYIDAELESLLRLAPVADAVQVDEPVAFLAHKGEGRYDIDDILERLKTPADQPAGDPPRFAVYNIVVSGGRLDFTDQSVGKTHALRELNLSVPFLSNLKSQREIKTSPHLAFKLNGSSFDTAAEGTPFAQTHKTDATLTLRGLDLNPYLAYWPASLPFKLQSAVLHADAKVAFEQTPATVVRISGTVTAEKVRLQVAGQAPAAVPAPAPAGKRGGTGGEAPPAPRPDLLAFERLQVSMADVRPLEQFVKLAAVELSAPALSVVRDRAGRLNLLPPAAAAATKNEADTSGSAKAPAGKASNPANSGASAKAPVNTPWKVQVARVAVRAGRVNWRDETLASPADIRLSGLVLNATAIAMPFSAGAPLQFDGSVGLEPPAAPVPSKAGARPAAPQPPAAPTLLSFKGSATDQAAELTAQVAAWPLGMAAKYVGQFLLPALNGQLDAELGIHWQAASGDKPQLLQLTAPQIALSEVQLAQGKLSLVSVKRVDLAQVDIDLTGQSFKAARLQLTQPKAVVDRGSDKRWMYERWMVSPGKAAVPPSPPSPTDAATRAAAPAWAVAINDVQLEGGSMSFSDKAGARPVAFEVTAAKAQLGGLLLDDRPASREQAAKPMPLTASLRLAAGRFEPGKVDFNGSLGLAPLQAQGRLLVDRLPVQAFEPYFADILNIELLRADASFKGKMAYRQLPAGPQAQVTGDVSLEEFRANTLAPSEDLLAWKALNLRGFHVALDPGKATRVEVKETVLSDFFARVIVMPDGRINLQDLVKSKEAAVAGGTPSAAAAPASAPVAPPKTVAADAKGAQAAAALPPVVSFGPISLINGKVLFSDRFVKPNYSADLSDLTGKLSAFSSLPPPAPAGGAPVAAPAMADLELRGRAEGTASLEILGKLNPLAKPLALDIKGKVRDLELPPLSPYSVKYSGYGIERGKLSVDVSYLVQPDGKLTATNKVILNQLSFGEKVPGSTASLPVKLAVALLADRNGVIDIDLPISGSLNDPQFSLGPIIVKVIVNVIVKAITSPFSLLANAFGGGGDELSTVGFAAGSAELGPEAKAGLDKVAKALADRPSLRLTVVGTSSVEAEREGFKRERLDALVRAEKRRITVKEGGTTSAAVSISPAEYPALLKEVYKRADMPKPRNLIGLAKDLPVAEMEKLLLADIQVNDSAMRELAVQRGVAVKDYLASRDLPPERLFLGAAKAVPPEAKWTPRAELNLAMP
ncbi:DUF748 domain-containing protein [Polaromonas sp. LjRoot131]|uniref:DUF748 domain-containing protein n=1 Tax=Polaromonas sp. LjRoot131 TaxID=3342262 RepID=UPI003F50326C